MAGDLKDQLKVWQTQNAPVTEKRSAHQGLTPKQARRAAAQAQRAAARDRVAEVEKAEPPSAEPLSDEDLFARAVSDIGDGSTAILKKYGHGHLSGEGEPEPAEPASQESSEDALHNDKQLSASDTNLFLDFVGTTKPVK